MTTHHCNSLAQCGTHPRWSVTPTSDKAFRTREEAVTYATAQAHADHYLVAVWRARRFLRALVAFPESATFHNNLAGLRRPDRLRRGATSGRPHTRSA